MGLLLIFIFIFCHVHPAIGYNNGAAATTEEPCQIYNLSSSDVITGRIIAGPNKSLDHSDPLFNAFSPLNYEGVFANNAAKKTDQLFYRNYSTKLYQFTCTYRL